MYQCLYDTDEKGKIHKLEKWRQQRKNPLTVHTNICLFIYLCISHLTYSLCMLPSRSFTSRLIYYMKINKANKLDFYSNESWQDCLEDEEFLQHSTPSCGFPRFFFSLVLFQIYCFMSVVFLCLSCSGRQEPDGFRSFVRILVFTSDEP